MPVYSPMIVAMLPIAADAPIVCPIMDLVALMAISPARVSKKILDSTGFHDIPKGSGCRMGIDIVDGVGFHAGIRDSRSHCRYLTIHVWHHNMRCVTCLSIASEARIHFCPPLFCLFFRLQDEHSRPSAITKPSRPLEKGRDARAGSVLKPGSQRMQHFETRHGQTAIRRLPPRRLSPHRLSLPVKGQAPYRSHLPQKSMLCCTSDSTPFSRCLIAIQAAAEFAIVRGTVKGGMG